ncbi:unnamed protein product [Paramecium sonneborni]|uniref:DJ-1/PfpI domain-containing protein n=1 Tax=Paramecium sonneborni TaxID=65129 RepID=A0A8S1LIK1_9CILI|nr:unnamed protein product [Paramecium sonneborni]
MQRQVLVPVSDGCEEIETVAIIDILRRANIDVTFASIKPVEDEKAPVIVGRSGISFICDTYLTEAVLKQQFDLIALPGGLSNAQQLGTHQPLLDRLRQQQEEGKWIAAICASPQLVLDKNGFMINSTGTCHPAHVQDYKGQFSEDRVHVSNKFITSRSPGTAIEFALALVELLVDQHTAIQMAKSLLVKR